MIVTKLTMDIKTVIKKHGFSQVEVAQKLGVSKGSFNQSVHNDNTSIKMLRRIAVVINCSVAEFFDDERETETEGVFCPKCGAKLKLVEVEE